MRLYLATSTMRYIPCDYSMRPCNLPHAAYTLRHTLCYLYCDLYYETSIMVLIPCMPFDTDHAIFTMLLLLCDFYHKTYTLRPCDIYHETFILRLTPHDLYHATCALRLIHAVTSMQLLLCDICYATFPCDLYQVTIIMRSLLSDICFETFSTDICLLLILI